MASLAPLPRGQGRGGGVPAARAWRCEVGGVEVPFAFAGADLTPSATASLLPLASPWREACARAAVPPRGWEAEMALPPAGPTQGRIVGTPRIRLLHPTDPFRRPYPSPQFNRRKLMLLAAN